MISFHKLFFRPFFLFILLKNWVKNSPKTHFTDKNQGKGTETIGGIFLFSRPLLLYLFTIKNPSKWSLLSSFSCIGISHSSARVFFSTAMQHTKCLWWTSTGKSFSTFSLGCGKEVLTYLLVLTRSCTACTMPIRTPHRIRIAHTTPKIYSRWCGRPKIFTTITSVSN